MSMQTNSAIRALAIAQDVANRTLAAALIYDNDAVYTITECSMPRAKQIAAMQGAAIGDAGHVIGVIYH
jgi:hypothetical protein